MRNAESSKTLAGIALALMAGYYLFRTQALLHAVSLLILLIAFPSRVSRFVAGCWTRFGELLGAVNSKVVLTMIYLLVLVPVSFCYRRLNPKVVQYFEGKELDSYFVESTTDFIRELFEKTW